MAADASGVYHHSRTGVGRKEAEPEKLHRTSDSSKVLPRYSCNPLKNKKNLIKNLINKPRNFLGECAITKVIGETYDRSRKNKGMPAS